MVVGTMTLVATVHTSPVQKQRKLLRVRALLAINSSPQYKRMAEHKFHFGRKETTRKEYAIIGVILDLLHYWIVDRLGVPEDFMQFIDEVNSNLTQCETY